VPTHRVVRRRCDVLKGEIPVAGFGRSFRRNLEKRRAITVRATLAIQGFVMAGLDPANPLIEARRCHIIGIAGSSPAMTRMGEMRRGARLGKTAVAPATLPC
jgi:hypothetical protein